MKYLEEIANSVIRLNGLGGQLDGVVVSLKQISSVDDLIDDEIEVNLEGIAAFANALQECEDAVTSTLSQGEEVFEIPDQISEHLRSSIDETLDNIKGFFETVATDIGSVQSELEELGENVSDLIRSKLNELGDIVEKLREDIFEKSEELWKDAVNEVTDEWKESLQEVVNDQIERFTEAGEITRKAIESSLESLENFAKDELSEMVREEARKVQEAALTRLQQEIVDGVMTSQIQVQLTSMMAPILPQLMVVRIVAGTIKQLLEILRMGF